MGKDIYEVNEYKWYFRALETRDEYFEYCRSGMCSGGFTDFRYGRGTEEDLLPERAEAGAGTGKPVAYG
jgi:hypothetical protein